MTPTNLPLPGGGMGCRKPPIELLRGAGVDLTRLDAIEVALRRFDRTLIELAQLLDVDLR